MHVRHLTVRLRRSVYIAAILATTSAFLAVAARPAPAAQPAPTRSASTAGDIIRAWGAQLGCGAFGGFKPVVLTASQSGTTTGAFPDALYVNTTVARRSDGALVTGRALALFADRTTGAASRPQPFNVNAADTSQFTLTLAGDLVEHSFTWGFTQTVHLQDIGNQRLAGWGGSIGNAGPPTYWVVASTPACYPIPG